MLIRIFSKSIDIVVAIFLSYLYRINPKYRNVWLFCERADEARDNAYFFYLYIKNKHPEVNAYYLVDKKSFDFRKFINDDSVVQYGSMRHKVLFILAIRLLSSHKGTVEPWNYQYYRRFFGWINRQQKYIFLQHGIILNDVSNVLGREYTSFDLFICGAKKEYDFILENFGYTKDEVVYTGLARFDYYNAKQNKKNDKDTILLMPTWRSSLKGISKKDFLLTDYYIRYQQLISNKKLLELLDLYNIELIFYPHYEMQDYCYCFNSLGNNVKLADKYSYDISDLIFSSRLLITDYSSISADFFYLRKPVIYYQFDEKSFFSKHYSKGYFDYKDGFGPSFDREEDVIEEISRKIKNDYYVSETYQAKYKEYFIWNDIKNCDRIYKNVIKL